MAPLLEFLRSFWIDLQNGQLPELGYWNYLVLAVLIVLQGPIVTLLAGAVSATGLIRPELVYLAAIAGNLTADVALYSVGASGRLDGFLKHNRIFGVRREHIEKIQVSVEEHAVKMLIIAKLSAGLAVPALIAAGIVRVPWRRWFPVVFIGELIWTGGLLLIGYFAAEAIKQVEFGIELVAVGGALVLVGSLVWIVTRSHREHNKVNLSTGKDRNSRFL